MCIRDRDIYENSAYSIQQELRRTYGDKLNLEVCIASVRDSKKIDALFQRYHPNVVFHAAAHKHVPLMEDAPEEAVKNNVFGTYNVALCAEKYGAEPVSYTHLDVYKRQARRCTHNDAS